MQSGDCSVLGAIAMDATGTKQQAVVYGVSPVSHLGHRALPGVGDSSSSPWYP